MGWFSRKNAIEACCIHLQGQAVPYTLKRSAKRKTVGLRIDDKGLTVNMPWRVSEQWLNTYLMQKSSWVIQKLEEFQSRRPPAMQWCHGVTIPYLGSELYLCLQNGVRRSKVALDGDNLSLWLTNEHDTSQIETEVLKWYRRQALACLNERVAEYALRLAVPMPKMRLSNAKTRWGSCNARGEIRLNWRLIKAPLEQIDYVVAHELAHLFEMNHSPAFWQTVARVFPEYERVRQALRAQSALYGLF
ncbi:M48 family metallopeptidase [Sulfurirhabdus autotrophica]|uniref:YgjP-like metallopeptidase domain-containing protein n=1 Tax=Sulfurirhabdus autotrophica TaxID=1706046 RepID=A0A4R3Y3L1_9PROT|nr:SprT family zinc-dependent metalloprotease [Sulfurirhabdus autotrophica]TCV84703.1 hypothetical protein EDC63_11147 [Sulfurirhabdus autotrophica]